MNMTIAPPQAAAELKASVYCPICTHTVEAVVERLNKRMRVKPGQTCRRCNSSLDAGFVLRTLDRAA